MTPKRRRILHRLFFTVLAGGTLVALFYAEENWRGARAWEAAKRELRARGETLQIADLIPPPVPDDQNLAMAPCFQRAFRYEVDPRTGLLTFNLSQDYRQRNDTLETLNVMPWSQQHNSSVRPAFAGNWMTGHGTDLLGLQAYYRRHKEYPRAAQPQSPAEDVLLALTHFQPVLDEVAQAAKDRPLVRFPINYTERPSWGIRIPNYTVIWTLTTTLSQRAGAELAVEQTAAAQRDVVLMLRLRRTMEKEPLIFAGLVDTSCLTLLMQPLWEGLAARQWSAEDLDAFRTELQGINFLREYQQKLRGERAFSNARWPEDLQNLDQARFLLKAVWLLSNQEPELSRMERWIWTGLPYWPRGWYAQNAALASRLLQANWIDLVDPVNRRVDLARNLETEQVMKELPKTPSTLLVRLIVAAYDHIFNKFAQAQTIVDQAMVACALERYYLAHHAYPDTLAALIPGYLDHVPNDVIDGAPLRYRLTVDGRYQLYSIGVNGRDDGGTLAWPANRKWHRSTHPTQPLDVSQPPFPSLDRLQGDWVWQYAPAEPPDPPVNFSRLESLPTPNP